MRGSTSSLSGLRQIGTRSLIAAVVALVLALTAASADPIPDVELPAATNIPATLSFAEIRAGLLGSLTRIKALDAEFTQLSRVSALHEAALTIVPYIFSRQSFKGERRYVFRRRLKYPYEGNLKADIAAAPGLGEDIRVYDGSVQRCYSPYGLSGVAGANIYSKKDGSADAQCYPGALGLAIADNVRAQKGEIRVWAGWPPDLYDHSGLAWVVEPMCERVDGKVCHVISEPTLGERKWIDPAIGYVVRFHEKKPREDPWRPAGEGVNYRSWHSDFREVAAGIWLPFRLRSVKYAIGDAAAQQPGSIVLLDDIVAVRLAVNDDVPDSLFKLSFQPGTYVTDFVRGVLYRVGENGEELDPESQVARTMFAGDRAAPRASIWLWVNAAIVAALAVFLVMRSLKKRRQPA
ncbi:MAG: hypothetical protein WCJ21_03000 [Planctomycetota bacterium]